MYEETPVRAIEQLKDQVDILLVTVTPIESAALFALIKPLPDRRFVLKISKDILTYKIGVLGNYRVCHVASKMGSIAVGGSLMTVGKAIEDWNPKFIVMVGIAFGKDSEEQNIGDVLVSARTIQYQSEKIAKTGAIEFRGDNRNCGPALLDRFKNYHEGWQHNIAEGVTSSVLPGDILSGEVLVDNVDYRNTLLERFSTAIGGEMEGVGLANAADAKFKEWILIKGICDFADGNKGINKTRNQEIAAEAAASLCEFVFTHNYVFEHFGIDALVETPEPQDIQEPEINKDVRLEEVKIPEIPGLIDTIMQPDANTKLTRAFFGQTIINRFRIGLKLGLIDAEEMKSPNKDAVSAQILVRAQQQHLLQSSGPCSLMKRKTQTLSNSLYSPPHVMTTPATAMLAPWIAKGVHTELSPNEQDAYQATITKLLNNNELAYWFGLIKLFSGFKDTEAANDLAAEFIKGVPKFPQQGNEQLLRVLAGCILAQKTESSSPSTDKVILSLLTANFSTRRDDLPIIELLTRTEAVWKKECLANRALPAALNLNTIPTKDKPLKPADQKEFINNIIPFFDNLDKRVAANSEETNILSWLFSSYSRTIEASFAQMGAAKLAFIGAKELADFTLIRPGHPTARGILNKMLDSIGSSMQDVSLSDIVHELNAESPYVDWVAETIRPRFMASGEVITPLLYALYCHAEFNNETDWKPIFKRRAGFAADFATTLSSFAMQFYKECMLMSIIHGNS